MDSISQEYGVVQAAIGSAQSEPVIAVRGLVKRYGGHEAVADIDLEVRRGEIFALLGPNGAGKTTTVEILEGFQPRTEGQVFVLGYDPATAGGAWRDRGGRGLAGVAARARPVGPAVRGHVRRVLPRIPKPAITSRASRTGQGMPSWLPAIIAIPIAAAVYLSRAPAHRYDVYLYLVTAAAGCGFGALATAATGMERDPGTGQLYTREALTDH